MGRRLFSIVGPKKRKKKQLNVRGVGRGGDGVYYPPEHCTHSFHNI